MRLWDVFSVRLAKINIFGKTFKYFIQKKPTFFSRKSQSLKLLRIFQQKYHLRRFLQKFSQNQWFWKSLGSFSELPIYFLGNLKLLNVFSSFDRSQKFESFQFTDWFWKNNRIFTKTTFVCPKTQKIDCFENSGATWKCDTHSR